MINREIKVLESGKDYNMTDDFFTNNPAFAGMDPQKMQFIKTFANMQKPQNMSQALPFLMAQMNQAKKQDINFNKPEVALIAEMLSKDLPPAEQERVKKMMQIIGG